MARCRPEHMPLFLAAVDVILDVALNIHDNASQDGEEMLTMIAHSMIAIGTNNMYIGRWFAVVLGPEHAAIIASGGFSKADATKFIFENSRVPLAWFPKVLREQIVEL